MASKATPAKAFPCPFPRCKSAYGQERNLKTHLCMMRGGGGDEIHPQNDPIWADLDSKRFLVRYTRPGLAPEQRLHRRKECQRRSYEKNKASILQQQKQKRDRLVEGTELAAKLATHLYEIRDRMFDAVGVVEGIFGTDVSRYSVSTFVDIHSGVSISTFPRLVAYFLPVVELPDIGLGVPGLTRIVDVIPGEKHYLQVSQLAHPDKCGEEGIQQRLDEAWHLCEDVLGNQGLEAALLFNWRNQEEISGFERTSKDHAKLANMFLEYMYARAEAPEVHIPQTLSKNTLREVIRRVYDVRAILRVSINGDWPNGGETGEDADGEHIEKLILRAMQLAAEDLQGRRRNRRRCESIASEGSSNGGNSILAHNMEVDDSTETIDPELMEY